MALVGARKEVDKYYFEEEFDCRRFIKVGDVIRFHSAFACDMISQVQRRDKVHKTAKVTEVHERFVKVRLNRVEECVNRWDIMYLNGRRVHNGCFTWTPPETGEVEDGNE